ncbi:hypothetical protein ACS0TY_010634 [Phlomoides rotata]
MGMYKPIEVGRDKIQVSHFQVDDTIFLGKATGDNIWFLKWFLLILEMVAGLKINRGKCNLFSLNVEDRRLEKFATIFWKHPQKSLEVGICGSEGENIIRRWEGLKIFIGGRL